ncbi:hypothetical protein Tco_1096078 [Tanacetum coccineum]
MGDVDINTLTMEQYLALIRDNNRPGVVRLEIGNDIDFEIHSQFMKELRRNLFASTDDEDDHKHVRRVLEIMDLFHIPGVTHDAIMLRVFPITLMGAARRSQALKSIQVMADHLHNWYDGASTRQRSNDRSDDIGVVTNRLDSLKYDMLKFKENIHAIQLSCKIYVGTHLTQECPLRNESKTIEQVKYIGFLEETVNKYCEESIKEQAANDEWIRNFRENTNLNLEKLDAITKNLEVKVEKLTKAILKNECNTVEKVKTNMEKAREVKKELVPRDLPIVNPYVPPIPFLGSLKKHEDKPYITRESICMIVNS